MSITLPYSRHQPRTVLRGIGQLPPEPIVLMVCELALRHPELSMDEVRSQRLVSAHARTHRFRCYYADRRVFIVDDTRLHSMVAGCLRDGSLHRIWRGIYVATSHISSIEKRALIVELLAGPHRVADLWTACWVWTGICRYPELSFIPPPNSRKAIENFEAQSGSVPVLNRIGRCYLTDPAQTAVDLARLRPSTGAIPAIATLLELAGRSPWNNRRNPRLLLRYYPRKRARSIEIINAAERLLQMRAPASEPSQ